MSWDEDFDNKPPDDGLDILRVMLVVAIGVLFYIYFTL